jgi:hypothetical protein
MNCPKPTTIRSGAGKDEVPYMFLAAQGIGSGAQRASLVQNFNQAALLLAWKYCAKTGCTPEYTPADSKNIKFEKRDWRGWREVTIIGTGGKPEIINYSDEKRGAYIDPPSPNVRCVKPVEEILTPEKLKKIKEELEHEKKTLPPPPPPPPPSGGRPPKGKSEPLPPPEETSRPGDFCVGVVDTMIGVNPDGVKEGSTVCIPCPRKTIFDEGGCKTPMELHWRRGVVSGTCIIIVVVTPGPCVPCPTDGIRLNLLPTTPKPGDYGWVISNI